MEPRTREEIMAEADIGGDIGPVLERFERLLIEVLVDVRDELHEIRIQLDKIRRYK